MTKCRGIALIALTAVVAAACSSGAKAPTSTPSTATSLAGNTGTTPAIKSSSSGTVVSVLASEGIATVASVKSTTPVVSVTGATIMRFTREGVNTMVSAAEAHTGLLGSVLDTTHATPAGDPSYSYLLAAWVSTGTSSGASEVRSLMGAQDWGAAPSVVFPVLALPLFTADVIHTAGVRATTSAELGVVTPATLTALVNAPCSLVSNFISDVLDTVAEQLMLASPSGSGVAVDVGSFFVNLWNTAVGLAHQAIKNLVKAVTDPVLKTIESVAASAAVIAEIATNITPWTVSVSASPPSIMSGDSGSFLAKVTSGLGVNDYPDAVKDCAGALGITLPSLTANGTPATWSVSGPLSPTSSTTVTLDTTGSNTLTYKTSTTPTNPSCGGTSPGPSPGSGSATITVTRPAINDLKTLVSNLLSTSIPVAGGVVGSILSPLVDEVLGSLDSVSQVTGTGAVTITSPPPGGGSGGSGTCPHVTTPPVTGSTSACMVGTWTAVNVIITNAGRGPLEGGAGSHWTIHATGDEDISWDGSGPFSIGGVPVFQYLGSSTETVRVPAAGTSSGPWSAHIDSDDVTAIYPPAIGKPPMAVPSDAGVDDSGTWTCSPGSLTVTANAEGSTITVVLKN